MGAGWRCCRGRGEGFGGGRRGLDIYLRARWRMSQLPLFVWAGCVSVVEHCASTAPLPPPAPSSPLVLTLPLSGWCCLML